MPIQVILGDIKQGRYRWLERIDTIKLKTGKLQHPGVWQRRCVKVASQGVQQGRANVARHCDSFSGTFDKLRGESSHRCFSVSPGDADNFRGVAALGFQLQQYLRKKAELVSNCGSSSGSSTNKSRKACWAKAWAL